MGVAAVFKILNGLMSGTAYLMEQQGVYSIGRSGNCELTLAEEVDNTVSRLHCSVQVDNDRVFIQDLNSRNGTYVSPAIGSKGHRVPGESPLMELTDGDVLKIGNIWVAVSITKNRNMASSSVIVLESSAYLPRLTKDEMRSEYENSKMNWWVN